MLGSTALLPSIFTPALHVATLCMCGMASSDYVQAVTQVSGALTGTTRARGLADIAPRTHDITLHVCLAFATPSEPATAVVNVRNLI